MTDETFSEVTQNLKENDYLLIELDKEFYSFLNKSKQDELNEILKEIRECPEEKKDKKKVKEVQEEISKKMSALQKEVTPDHAIGRVSESLMSLVYLLDVHDSSGKGPSNKAFENREIQNLSVITEEVYQELKAKYGLSNLK